MSIIDDNYIKMCNIKSDINELLPKIKELATGFKHITEFGVRSARSTWALLSVKPNILISYDITPININSLMNAAKDENIAFKFYNQNTCEIQIEDTDILFIDTFHAYKQLKTELFLHHSKVKSFIIMHDTTTYGLKDEKDSRKLNENTNYINNFVNKSGLQLAINEFLSDNGNWSKFFETDINNGLTVLKRN